MSSIEQLEYLDYLSKEDKKEYKGLETYHKNLRRNIGENMRENNGKNERVNIKDIMNHLNTSTPLGIKLILSLEKDMNIEFKKAYERNGNNRHTHYDFVIIDKNGKEYQIEHKGSCLYKKIKDTDKPFKSGVQFVNAGCEKFEISRIYASLWYEEYIKSGYLSKTYKLESEIPTFNTWYKSDCCTQGNPKTKFGEELKKKYRNEYGKTSLLKLRKKINDKFLDKIGSDNKILENFKQIVINIGNTCLNEKHVWIQINGDINGDINKIDFKWYNGFKLNENYKVQAITKSDIDFYFNSDSKDFNFRCKLRWGKGCGFSNLRIDFK